jgi:soluble lytic murein transglycosylase-like protein
MYKKTKRILYIGFCIVLLGPLAHAAVLKSQPPSTNTTNETKSIKRTLSSDDHSTEKKAQRYFTQTVRNFTKENPLAETQNLLDQKTIIAYITKYHPQIGSRDRQTIASELVAQSKTHHVDPKFIAAIIGAESGFNKNANSPSGAKGLGQLMRGTYAAFNVQNPFDIKENISATIQYCNRLFTLFGAHTMPLSYSLAAYLRGDQAVKRANGNFTPYTIKYIQTVFKKYHTICQLQEQTEH